MASKHPAALVARIKGLHMAGVKPKALAALTNISVHTIWDWINGRTNSSVVPDPKAKTLLANTLKIMGDD